MQDARSGDLDAKTKLDTFVRALQGGIKTCPIVQRSLEIIVSNLNAARPQESAGNSASTLQTDDQVPLPAFPRQVNPGTWTPQNSNPGFETSSHFWLDCFPENNMQMDLEDWYIPPG
jgi:hypothetical protein